MNYILESFESGSNSGFVQGQSISPTEGSYYYFNRRGWGNIDSELKTTTSKSLEPGIYYVTIDYKAAEYANTFASSFSRVIMIPKMTVTIAIIASVSIECFITKEMSLSTGCFFPIGK